MSMQKNSWFRVYGEIVDDDRLGLLAFQDRWHFVAILALKSTGLLDDRTGSSTEMWKRRVAYKLGVTVIEMDELARRLAEVGLINRETLQPLKWQKRQYVSDSSADRTREYRKRLKSKEDNCTKRHGDVTVTPPDTDTDTDTEKRNTEGCVTVSEPEPDLVSEASPCAPGNPDAPENLPPDSLRRVRQTDLPPGYKLRPPKPEEPPKTKTEPIPFAEFTAAYNAEMDKLPKVRALTAKRRTQLRRLWHEVPDFHRPGFIAAYFETCNGDKFLNGEGPYGREHSNWRPTFDYLTRPDTAVRVIEGALS